MHAVELRTDQLATWPVDPIVAKYFRTPRRLAAEIASLVLPFAVLFGFVSIMIGRVSIVSLVIASVFAIPLAYVWRLLIQTRIQRRDSNKLAEPAIPALAAQAKQWPWTIIGHKQLPNGSHRFTVLRGDRLATVVVNDYLPASAPHQGAPVLTFGEVEFERYSAPLGVHGRLRFLGPVTVWCADGQVLPEEPADKWMGRYV